MQTDLKSLIGLRLRAERLARGLTQEWLAEHIGRTVETVSNIERGKALPGLDTLERMCGVLEMPLARLFAETTEPAASRRRIELEARLRTLADTLTDTDLEIAVEQMQVLVSGRAGHLGR
jgi:transcriptional regulator with XRE-family HTH domain